MPSFPRSELEEMMGRWLDLNRRCEETARLGADGRHVHRGRHLRVERRSERRVHGRRPRRDPRVRPRHRDGGTRAAGPTPTSECSSTRRRARSSGCGSRSPTRRRSDGSHYEIAGLGGSWFRYAGGFRWSWQRDFFDVGNATATFVEMIGADALSPGMQQRIEQAAGAPGTTGRRHAGRLGKALTRVGVLNREEGKQTGARTCCRASANRRPAGTKLLSWLHRGSVPRRMGPESGWVARRVSGWDSPGGSASRLSGQPPPGSRNVDYSVGPPPSSGAPMLGDDPSVQGEPRAAPSGPWAGPGGRRAIVSNVCSIQPVDPQVPPVRRPSRARPDPGRLSPAGRAGAPGHVQPDPPAPGRRPPGRAPPRWWPAPREHRRRRRWSGGDPDAVGGHQPGAGPGGRGLGGGFVVRPRRGGRARRGPAHDLGLDLDRAAVVPRPGAAWAEVGATLLDGIDLVVLGRPSPLGRPWPAGWWQGPVSGGPSWWCWRRGPDGRSLPTSASRSPRRAGTARAPVRAISAVGRWG